MKFIKGLLITIVALVLIYAIMALFLPNNYKVERKLTMDAPSNIVFEQISKFNNWEAWSPWKECDQTATYTITGTDGSVGANYKWSGDPKITGKGGMTTTEVLPNQKFAYDLAFTEPWESCSKGYFTFTETNTKTTVTWADEGQIPFMARPMMYFMDLEGMMGPMFERGLFKIDSISTIIANDSKADETLTETQFEGGKYIGIITNLKISEIDSSLYANSFQKLGKYLSQNKLDMAGSPCCITTKWDIKNDSCTLMLSFPITEKVVPNEASEITYLEIPLSPSLLYNYYGEYELMGSAFNEIHKYISNYNLLAGDYAIEQYITDPSTVKSMDEVLTKIYYLIK